METPSPLPHCSLTKVIWHTSWKCSHCPPSFAQQRKPPYYQGCCYTSTLFANMKAYSRIANSPSRWHFNQYQMWITSLKNQITDNGHSLWFVFFWLVWISIQTISIKFLIICPNHNHYTNKSESRLSYNFAQTIKFAWLSMLIAKYWVWFKIWESPHKRYPLNFVCVSKNVWNVM